MSISIHVLAGRRRKKASTGALALPSTSSLFLLFAAGALLLGAVKLFVTDHKGVRRQIKRPRKESQLWDEYKYGIPRDREQQAAQRERLRAWADNRALAEVLGDAADEADGSDADEMMPDKGR
jgi:hypothetical protein